MSVVSRQVQAPDGTVVQYNVMACDGAGCNKSTDHAGLHTMNPDQGHGWIMLTTYGNDPGVAQGASPRDGGGHVMVEQHFCTLAHVTSEMQAPDRKSRISQLISQIGAGQIHRPLT